MAAGEDQPQPLVRNLLGSLPGVEGDKLGQHRLAPVAAPHIPARITPTTNTRRDTTNTLPEAPCGTGPDNNPLAMLYFYYRVVKSCRRSLSRRT